MLWYNKPVTYLVVMRSYCKDDRTVTGNIECTPWTDFSKKYVRYDTPENNHCIVSHVRSNILGDFKKSLRCLGRHLEVSVLTKLYSKYSGEVLCGACKWALHCVFLGVLPSHLPKVVASTGNVEP